MPAADGSISSPTRREAFDAAFKVGVGLAALHPLSEVAAREAPAPGFPVAGYAARDATTPLGPFSFQRRQVGPNDVRIEILFCGVCHSDIHTARNEWLGTVYPCVPGHEILGRVVEVGGKVRRFKVDDLAAVGCMVNSCQHCESCLEGLEQYCENNATFTYNTLLKGADQPTFGGYSTAIVVTEKFVVKIPPKMEAERTAPLLCAGITTYSPMRHWKVRAGQKVGIVGIGGLGHVAVKIAKALGAQTFAITTTPGKLEDSRRLGAEGAILSTDGAAMKKHENSFDFLLSTIPQKHDLNPYVALLKRDRPLVIVGDLDPKTSDLVVGALIVKRKSVAGSLIGGMAETQEMVNFCEKHGILADVEVIPIAKINQAYERVIKKDVRYRFVIDVASLKK